jgi:hypothetical protein
MAAADMHMQPSDASARMQQLAAESRRLNSAWTAKQGEIGSGAAAIGGDRLSAAFRPGYDADSQVASDAANAVVSALARDAQVGNACVQDYIQGDDRARDAIANVTPSIPLSPGRPF